jgi:ABC-type Fe3+/spermidine/putrescine transport system ATPase subunit
VADRIVVMHAGRVEQVGTPEAIYVRPATPFVAEFIGQCNFLSGQVHAPEGSAPLFRADDGLTFPLSPSASASHGQRGTVALRPEAIALLGLEETPAPGATVVNAVVQRVTYLGALRQYRMTTDARTELRVDCQVGPLGTHAQAMTEGAAVRLAWLPASCTFQPAVPGPIGSAA